VGERTPAISVVIPTYNPAQYLREALDSALSQTYGNREIIVVDDGSTDGTPKVLLPYLGHITYLRQANAGVSAARNTGIRAARGEWVAFLDDDDLWHPDKIARQVAAAGGDSGCVASFTDRMELADDTVVQSSVKQVAPQVRSGWILEELFHHNFICTSSVMVRRQTLLALGGFDESLRQSEDWHLWLRIAARHRWAFVDEVLVTHRARPSSLSTSIEGRLAGCRAALEKIVAEVPRLRPLERRIRATQLLSAGTKYYCRGDYRLARAKLAEAIRTNPGVLRSYPYLAITLAPGVLVPAARNLRRAALGIASMLMPRSVR